MERPAKSKQLGAKTQEDLNALLAKGAEPRSVNVPGFYVTSTRMSADSKNVNLVFSKTHPVDIVQGNETIHGATLSPVVMMDMSPQTAKDLMLLLQDRIAEIEREWGTIETEFTRRRKQT